GAYSFDNILPGKYEVTVEKNEWCWESTSYILDVNSLESNVPIFVQTGFTVTFVSSHDTEVLYNLQTSHNIDKSFHKIFVKSGITKVCVSKPGLYEFKPLGCHGYTQPLFQWNSAAMPVSIVKLTAISHTVGGHVISSENVSDIYITVVFAEDKKIKTRSVLYNVWHKYIPNSLKESTREKRGKGVRREVAGKNKLAPLKWTDFLQEPTNNQ
ncbi:unnamed protein product, partial [Timema podura]|nr:unnamed protein product [Timema podura]